MFASHKDYINYEHKVLLHIYIYIRTKCDEGSLSTKVYVWKIHYSSGVISKRPFFILLLL